MLSDCDNRDGPGGKGGLVDGGLEGITGSKPKGESSAEFDDCLNEAVLANGVICGRGDRGTGGGPSGRAEALGVCCKIFGELRPLGYPILGEAPKLLPPPPHPSLPNPG